MSDRTPDETVQAFLDAYRDAYYAVPAQHRTDEQGHWEAHEQAVEAGLVAVGAIPSGASA